MREIKFRAWYYNGVDLQTGNMQYDVLVNAKGLACVRDGLVEVWSNCVKVMQYTGLKDSRGVEIYEGDILKGKRYSGEEHIQKVHWVSYRWEGINRYDASEVIGNIYENKKLLHNDIKKEE